MIRDLLDTDIATFWLHGHPAVVAAVQSHDIREIAIPVVVLEEIWDGWQAVIRQAKTSERMAFGYAELTAALDELRVFHLVTYTASAIDRHAALKKQKLNVGGNDLKVAAVALDLSATVVTNNEQDFRRVPA